MEEKNLETNVEKDSNPNQKPSFKKYISTGAKIGAYVGLATMIIGYGSEAVSGSERILHDLNKFSPLEVLARELLTGTVCVGALAVAGAVIPTLEYIKNWVFPGYKKEKVGN